MTWPAFPLQRKLGDAEQGQDRILEVGELDLEDFEGVFALGGLVPPGEGEQAQDLFGARPFAIPLPGGYRGSSVMFSRSMASRCSRSMRTSTSRTRKQGVKKASTRPSFLSNPS